MQHASETIGAIAGALAKAQVEILNPEKSLTVTISAPDTGGERTFRYAPLSSGLDIVRKSLGRHEIATVQSTSIDAGAGLIRLTTVLAHSSGEWISSEFPVCPVSETATPHRLGAALTYARRYALFALVGIAGEDDVDAPDLPMSERARPPSFGPSEGAHVNGGAARAKSAAHPPGKAGSPRSPVHVLPPEHSAALREQMERGLADLASAEQLTAWANRALALKASLVTDDAAAIEHAFAQRMSAFETSTVPETERAEAGPTTSPAPPQGGNGTRAPITPVPKTPRRRNKKHLHFVSKQPCVVCGRAPSDAHHLRFAEPRALGRKVSDEFTVPLCRAHHRALHNCGDERAWWEDLRIDPSPIAHQLWSETR